MSLSLDLGDISIMSKLKWEMRSRRQKQIVKVSIECLNADFWIDVGASLSDHELISMFTCVGHAFPYLREIEMKVFELPLPVTALDQLLQLTKSTLEAIEMEDVILKGSKQELESLASTFQSLPALKKVHLDWCQPLGGSLEPVLLRLATVKTLTQLKIGGSFLSVASIRLLCSNQSLKRLTLLDDNLPHDGMDAVAEALESPVQHIRQLSIRLCRLDPSTAMRFANVLQLNRTLERLEIRIKDSDWNAYGSSFSYALKNNATLTHVAIIVDGDNTDVKSVAKHLISSALSRHPTLKVVRIALRRLVREPESDILPQAFLGPVHAMLQTNTTLEQLQIDGIDSLPVNIDFFLRANRAGRGELLQKPAAHGLWIQRIVEQRRDVAFTYLLLSLNPTLCPKTITKDIIEVDC